MSLNHSPNIEWIHPDPAKRFTANPITGCKKGCGYCYGRDIHNRFKWPGRFDEPKFHPERLALIRRRLERRKDNVGVFLLSVSDPFGLGVDPDWTAQVFDLARTCPQHTFYFLTKRPDRMVEYCWYPSNIVVRPNIWLGVSVESNAEIHRIKTLSNYWPGWRFVSLEPLQGQVFLPLYCQTSRQISLSLDWVVLGGLSGSKLPPGYAKKAALLRDQATWGKQIITDCQGAKLPVFTKTRPIRVPGLPVIQQWPEIINKNAGVEQ